jgi:hypothetical protein
MTMSAFIGMRNPHGVVAGAVAQTQKRNTGTGSSPGCSVNSAKSMLCHRDAAVTCLKPPYGSCNSRSAMPDDGGRITRAPGLVVLKSDVYQSERRFLL